MKKLLLFLLVITACSKDDDSEAPRFIIYDNYLRSQFESFVGHAYYYTTPIPQDNMILRLATGEKDTFINNSTAYKVGKQLYIDIDKGFIDAYAKTGRDEPRVLFQQFANGLLETPFRECGIMKKVENADDLTGEIYDYDDWADLFDPSSPCD